MKVLRIIASVDPRLGGPGEAVLRSAEAMAKVGHSTEVATLDLPDSEFLKSFPIRTHPLGEVGPFSRVRYSSRLVPWLRMHALDYNVATIEGLWNYASIGGWLGIGRLLPYVVFPHGMMDPWFRVAAPLKHAVKRMYWRLGEGRVLRDARYVLFTTEEEQRLAQGVFGGHSYRGKVVAFGTADAPGQNASEGERQKQLFRSKLPALGNRPYLLFLSRIDRKKGCDLLLRAFARLAEEFPDIDLVVAGPDLSGLRKTLEAESEGLGIAGRVHWPGMLMGDEKWGAFRGAAAFVLSSHQENFGIVVAEALSCSTPVLISSKVNIWREVKSSGAGLVADDTESGTYEMLKQFLRLDLPTLSEMRSAARYCFLSQFEIGSAANDLTEVLKEIAIQ